MSACEFVRLGKLISNREEGNGNQFGLSLEMTLLIMILMQMFISPSHDGEKTKKHTKVIDDDTYTFHYLTN